MTKNIIVAIDGYSSCGKSTIAKALAKYAGYMYVDTGAMYRTIALYMLRHGIEDDRQVVASLNEVKVGFVLTGGARMPRSTERMSKTQSVLWRWETALRRSRR